jgi:hypothetical protein
MAWKIDRDYLKENEEEGNVGRESVKPLSDAPRYRFRLRDDDGEVYYGGWFDMADDDEGDDWESSPYGCWSWGMWDSGATDFQIRAEAAETTGLYSGAVERYGAGEWVSIYA